MDRITPSNAIQMGDAGYFVQTSRNRLGKIINTNMRNNHVFAAVELSGLLYEFDALGFSTYDPFGESLEYVDRPVTMAVHSQNNFWSMGGLPPLPTPQILDEPEYIYNKPRIQRCWNPRDHIWVDTGMTLTFCKKCDVKARLNMMSNSFEIIEDDVK